MDDRIAEHRDSHASSSHEPSLEPTYKIREDLGKHSVHTQFPKDRSFEISQRTKIRRGLKLEGLRNEDAMVEPYFVLKNLVT